MSQTDKALAALNPDTPPKVKPEDAIVRALELQREQIARALPAGYDPDRLTRVIQTVVKLTPRLLDCTPGSILGAAMTMAQLGLEPGPLQQCYMVPRRSNNVWMASFMLGYRGIITLARRSGEIDSIEARAVYANDEFDYALGTRGFIHHKPTLDEDRGPLRCFYGVSQFRPSGTYFEVVPLHVIAQHRARSSSPGKGPWVDDYEPMARKTVVRIMEPYLPLSIETMRALSRDDTVTEEIAPDMLDEPVDVDSWEADDERPFEDEAGA